ncbi:hypothetical protein [Stenotrophomonas humi]
MTKAFMDAHPDMHHRHIALNRYREGRFVEALQQFIHAARYADKFSQSMVARMHWEGQGTKADRALGYAWMDLAAERAYHDFLRQRELYWSVLDETERADAVERGQAVYAEYRDRVAKPRLERELNRATQKIIGSRTGFVSSGLSIRTKDGTVPGSIYYDKNYYQPALYWCTQDAYWSRPLNPSVDVGQPETLSDAPPGDKTQTEP